MTTPAVITGLVITPEERAESQEQRARQSKSWERSLTNHIRNDINWRMRPLLLAMIAMHREWEEETGEPLAGVEVGR